MYIEDAQRYPANFKHEQITRIVESLNATNPLTLFAPSGFGKSILLRYMAFNMQFRKQFKQLRNTAFAYMDITEVVTELRSIASLQAATGQANATQNQILEQNLWDAIKMAVELHKLNSPVANNLKEYLDKLFTHHKRQRLYVILDGAEQLFAPEFELTRDYLKYIRDKYRGQLDYIFALNDSRYLEQINYKNLGQISSLLGQKIVSIPLMPSASYIHTAMHGGHNLFYRLWKSRRPGVQDKLAEIDKLTGGYAPYIKYFLHYGNEDVRKVQLVQELQMASERLLSSLTQEQINYLRAVAAQQAAPPVPLPFKMLGDINLVQQRNGRLELFSPIMTAYLRLNLPQNR